MSEQFEESPVHFGSHSRNGVYLGLDATQVTIVGSGAGVFVLCCMVSGTVPDPMRILGLGLVVLLVSLGVGVPRFADQTIPRWMRIIGSRLIRGTRNHLVYLRKFDEEGHTMDTHQPPTAQLRDPLDPLFLRDVKGRLKLGAPQRLSLGGSEADNLVIYEGPRRIAFIYDPRRGTGTVVARTRSTKALDLESDEAASQRVESFSRLLNGASSVQGLLGMQFGDQGRKVSGSKILEYYDERIQVAGSGAGDEINVFADQSYRDLITTASSSYIHETWVAFIFSRGHSGIERSVKKKGGGVAGFFDAVLDKLSALEDMIDECGAHVTEWHSPRSISEVIRVAFDPQASTVLTDRRGDFAGVAVASAGPMAVDDRQWDHLRTDTGFHRVYRVMEWPRQRAELGFMQNLILTGGHRQTVTIMMMLKDQEKAYREIDSQKADWETTHKTHVKMKKMFSRRQAKELEDIENREEELVAGHAAYTLGAFVTVSSESLADLEADCAAMSGGASNAKTELRALYGQQLTGFIAGALPLARGHIGH
ncbi:SCO6880 family protein [Glutamicibacter uratoxydans]|uniref:SCO6880 family protein n=1 Tax=Glutamicibacter uratoxydans TaxID=43667 RepID=UPI003D6F6EAC